MVADVGPFHSLSDADREGLITLVGSGRSVRFAGECQLVCVWVPDLREEMNQNDYCGTTRLG